MDTLYTVRQVQDLLKVDRITIYRMLQDGRLKGIKIGQQWRFPTNEVERLLSGDVNDGVMAAIPSNPDNGFPTHCVQTIQNLFSEISQLSALVVDMGGEPLTNISHPTPLQTLLGSSSAAVSAYKADWKSFAVGSTTRSLVFVDHCGFSYSVAPISTQTEQVGAFVAGPFYWQKPDRYEEAERIHHLASSYHLDAAVIQEAFLSIPVIPADRRAQVEAWPKAASQAVQSILMERTGFIQRLQKIANLTQIS
jgi:excisionase family DNA binding protein